MLLAVIFLLAGLAMGIAVEPPAQLFSPLVPRKVLATFNALQKPIRYPQYTTRDGTWLYFSPNTWTSGFLPATAYELNTRKKLCPATSDNFLGIGDWLSLGRGASVGLIPLEDSNTVGHDVGFISYPFVEELTVNPRNKTAIAAVTSFAHSLAARYNSNVRATRSWDTKDPTDFQVIIDNMMNLELLFHAEALTGNSTLRDIATAHADTTMENHIRRDGSTWHVVEYNSTTGHVIKKRTAQGYSDDSTWSRGQAWGIYGYATMYKYTNNTAYLTTSRQLATYFLNNIPPDGIVPWDFDAPRIPAPRPADSSAATIAVNGLLLLSGLEESESQAKRWRNAAINILNKITALAWNPSWESILSNGTVNNPAGNKLTGTVYGDYFYIKAGNELISQGLATC